jgi:hypothetical protein
MTTAQSPMWQLRQQAHKIADNLKKLSRGETVTDNFGRAVQDPAGKIAASKETGIMKFGVAMDDGLIMLELPWTKIRAMTQAVLASYILKCMRESRRTRFDETPTQH